MLDKNHPWDTGVAFTNKEKATIFLEKFTEKFRPEHE
jgi:hypothetical protein